MVIPAVNCEYDRRFILSRIEVSLLVKRECVRVTSHSGTQFRYTSRSRTLLGFASRDDMSQSATTVFWRGDWT